MYFINRNKLESSLLGSILNKIQESGNLIMHFRQDIGEVKRCGLIQKDYKTIIHAITVFIDRFVSITGKKLVGENNFNNDCLKLERTFWDLYITIFKIELIIGIEPSIEMCKAAKKRNIKTIDIEHGMRTRNSYYLRDEYRYDNKGYPSIMTFRSDDGVERISKIIPQDTHIMKNLDFQYNYEYKEYISYKENRMKDNYILFIDQYLKRGSKESHKMYSEMQNYQGKIVVRIHPRFKSNRMIYKRKIDDYLKQNDGYHSELCLSNQDYLISDLADCKGVISYSSTCFIIATEMNIPVFVYGNPNGFTANHAKGMYGFERDLRDEWSLFIQNLKTTDLDLDQKYEETEKNINEFYRAIGI